MTSAHNGMKALKTLERKVKRACRGNPAYEGLSPVTGRGPVPGSLMVVGEAPGRKETETGEPFVGRAGSFFISLLEKALKVKREDVYITNVVKVWPVVRTKRLRTRKPAREEVALFRPFLMEEIEIVRPRVILAVGRTAFEALLPGEDFKRGVWFSGPEGIPVIAVYHPAYILRRQKAMDDHLAELRSVFRKIRKRLGAR